VAAAFVRRRQRRHGHGVGKIMKAGACLLSLLLAPAAVRAEPAEVIKTNGLPACVQTVAAQSIQPGWQIVNHCGAAIEIVWCWKDVPAGWRHADNTCSATGHRSSGAIAPDARFEFPDRPYLDNTFRPSAMLTVFRVCRVAGGRTCSR
jgi:hypothetical protein